MLPSYFFHYGIPTIQVGTIPHIHMMPSTLPTSGTKIKRAIAQWIPLLVVGDDGCGLTFAKVTNLNIINTVAKSSCITHPPN